MKLTIEMDMNNSAFEADYAAETAFCLNRVLERVRDGISADHILDSNGNKVGGWRIDFDD